MEVGELANVFQNYNQRFQASNSSNLSTNIKNQYSHYVEYSDTAVTSTNPDASSRIANSETTPRTFRVTFINTDEDNLNLPSTEADRPLKGLINKFEYFKSPSDPDRNVIILWDFDNVTRGAARLFGFLPKETSTDIVDGIPIMFSNRLLDVSSHFVDLVIPEIPSVACKRNLLEEILLNVFSYVQVTVSISITEQLNQTLILYILIQ